MTPNVSPSVVKADVVKADIVKALAPSGKLRAAINFGNIVLAQKDPATGEPRGVSGELARELATGVKQPMVAFAKAHPDLRLLPGRFMAIEQAMGAPKGRDAGVRYLREFVEEMKASGLVAKALEVSGQHDAVVAPPTPVV